MKGMAKLKQQLEAAWLDLMIQKLVMLEEYCLIQKWS